MKNSVDNIFLIGPMGAGKTTIGKLLAQELKLEFYDSDHELRSAREPMSPGFLIWKVRKVFVNVKKKS